MSRITKIRYVLLFSILSSSLNITYAGNDAASGSDDLEIPEPLVFDLVRPLGSPKGELEVNLLANQAGNSNTLNWSPEIEYVVSDGLSIELELPHSQKKIQEYKFGLQGTFGKLLNNNMIHGWQVIARKVEGSNIYYGDALYINAFRVNPTISSVSMLGLRSATDKSFIKDTVLLNAAIFFKYSSYVNYGIEINNEFSSRQNWGYRLTPQIHYSLAKNQALQVGVGPSNINLNQNKEWLFTSRYSYSF
jgi:hypothetical protein